MSTLNARKKATDYADKDGTFVIPKITSSLPTDETSKERRRRVLNKKKMDPSKLPSPQEIEDKLITARIGLVMRQPFFAALAIRLTMIRDDEHFDTAATDGRNFFYNGEFIANLTVPQTEFLFGHEVLHNVLEHHFRRESRIPVLWNIAADYVINLILVQNGIGKMPDNLLYDTKYEGMTSEEVYDDLMKNADKLDIDQMASKLLDDHLDDMEKDGKQPTEGEKQGILNDIREALLSAAQAAGNVPKGLDRYITGLTAPKMNWKELLRQDIQAIIRNDFSFSRPNKKGMSEGIVLPGMLRESALDICVAIDCSGSISDEDARVFLSEVKGIMSQYDEYIIRIWSFDTAVHAFAEFRSDEGADIETYVPKGGGGTSFECNFEYMKDHDIQPKIFIMFTDMCPNAGWGDESYCENMIFVGYRSGGKEAPFGITITMED